MSEQPQAKRSPWVYVGIGCVGAVVLAVVVCLAGGFWAKRAADNYVEEMSDSTKREAKAKKVALEQMGAIPDGYYAVFSFGIPLLMDMVMLSDTPPAEDAGMLLGDRGLIFIRAIDAEDGQQIRDWFDGKDVDPRVLQNKGINIDARAQLGRGKLKHNGVDVFYVAQRGKVMAQGQNNSGPDSLNTTLFFDCPKDGKQRFGIWFQKDSDPDKAVADIDRTGTVTDEKEIEAFIAPLKPCGK